MGGARPAQGARAARAGEAEHASTPRAGRGWATRVTYDTFSLLVTTTRDPLGNTTSAENDYRVLAPSLTTDANLNRTAVAFDALGMVVKTAVMGKEGANEGDTLEHPTTELQYDLLRWQREQKPTVVHTIAREEHFFDNATSRFQHAFAYSDGFGRIVQQKVQAEPETGTNTPRWVGTGRTVFNNKGNPVKQYEPFFSATSDFEDEDAIVVTGATPIIHYDPLDRVIRTDFPDGTFSKVEFDPWTQTTFDQNDTVLESQWYIDRGSPSPSGAEPSAPDARAAWLAAQHANTPTVVHLDTLGRPFLSDAHNRTGGVDDHYFTKTKLDIEGNTLAIFDARQIKLHEHNSANALRSTIDQTFDVLQRRVKVVSADAGTRLAVADVAGKPLRAWDSRGQSQRQRFDALQRPTHAYVRKGASERLLLRTVYGEALDPAGPPPIDPAFASSAQQANLRGRAHHVYDCAGLVTSIEHDFKGNLLGASRRLAVAYQTEPDWSLNNAADLASPAAILNTVASLLQDETFTTTSTFDALNRVTTATAPDASPPGAPVTNAASVTRPVYNEANLLEAVHVVVRGAAETPVITDLDYNARGQRVLCANANGTITTYEYDPKTFRLTEQLTLRGVTKLQHLLYSYDPVGNITDIQDLSNWDSVLSALTAAGITRSGKYRYDALYRLLSATGREHPGPQPNGRTETEPPRWGIPHTNDLQALQSYREEVAYDAVGNIVEMRHLRGSSNNASWSRRYDYFPENNRLRATSAPGDAIGSYSDPYGYQTDALNDAGRHGSMTSMPHLASMEWDYADRLKHTLKSNGSAQDTHFTYDAAGQRARKVYHHNGVIEERIYLGGYEVYRRHSSGAITATPEEERQTLHVMDDKRRVAMVETKTRDAGAAIPTPNSRWRFQLDDHLGSATLELDASGNVISYEEYHPHGSTAFHTADGNAQVSAKRYRYTGKENDDETGLYYHGARYFAPWLGRWTSADPAGLDAGINIYGYVRGNPISRSDPTGMWDWDWKEFGKGVAAGAAGVAVGVLVVAAFATGVGEVALLLGASAVVAEGLATSVVVGAAVVGAASTGVKIGEVATGETLSGEKLSDAQRTRMVGEAAVEGLALLGGAARARGRIGAEKAADRSMVKDLVAERKTIPIENQGRTLSTGRTGDTRTPIRESTPQAEHAEPQTLRDLSLDPKAGRKGQVVAVDQIPCETCAPKLGSELPPGSRVVVPKLRGGEPPAPPGSKQPLGTSPKQAAKKAATGKGEVEPHTLMTTPRSPAQVGRSTPPTGGLVLLPTFTRDRKDDKSPHSAPPAQPDTAPTVPILQFKF